MDWSGKRREVKSGAKPYGQPRSRSSGPERLATRAGAPAVAAVVVTASGSQWRRQPAVGLGGDPARAATEKVPTRSPLRAPLAHLRGRVEEARRQLRERAGAHHEALALGPDAPGAASPASPSGSRRARVARADEARPMRNLDRAILHPRLRGRVKPEARPGPSAPSRARTRERPALEAEVDRVHRAVDQRQSVGDHVDRSGGRRKWQDEGFGLAGGFLRWAWGARVRFRAGRARRPRARGGLAALWRRRSGMRYSPATQISKENVGDLEVA
jgi:hypothetical protein